MKTSNILLTIFIGSITLYFLAAFARDQDFGKTQQPGPRNGRSHYREGGYQIPAGN